MPERFTPDLSALFKPTALDKIGAEILNGGPHAIRYRETRAGGKSIVFVAHHDDVVRVLKNDGVFSLCNYERLYSSIAPPGAFLIMWPEGPERAERLKILSVAAAKTPWFQPEGEQRRALTRQCADNVLASVRHRRRFDLIGEYGFFIPFLVAKSVLGLIGPQSFSALALVTLLNGRSLLELFRPETRPYLTNVSWAEFVVAQLMTNFENRKWYLRILARYGASRLRGQIQRNIEYSKQTAGDHTLLSALWKVRPQFSGISDDAYREHVICIMVELTATFLMTLGLGFTNIIKSWLRPCGPGLQASLRVLGTMDAEEFSQEQLRLAPSIDHLLRNAAVTGIHLGGLSIEKGEYVCALIKSAGTEIKDPEVVEAGRCPKTYLHFGPENGPHRCFGHLLAPAVLAEMFLGLTRLPNLAPGSRLIERGPVPARWIFDFGGPAGTWP